MKWNERKLVLEAATEGGSGGGEPVPAGVEGGDAAPVEAPAMPDLSWVPETYRGEDGSVDLEAFQQHYSDVTTSNAPETADAYEMAMPGEMDWGDFAPPEGVNITIDTEDEAIAPLFSEARSFLHEMGAPPEAAGKMMGILGKYEAAKAQKHQAAAAEQMQALGPKAEARLSTMQRALETRLPKELAAGLMGAAYTADAVKALERLIAMPKTTPVASAAPAEYDPIKARFGGK